jgi:hypothetical protein
MRTPAPLEPTADQVTRSASSAPTIPTAGDGSPQASQKAGDVDVRSPDRRKEAR